MEQCRGIAQEPFVKEILEVCEVKREMERLFYASSELRYN